MKAEQFGGSLLKVTSTVWDSKGGEEEFKLRGRLTVPGALATGAWAASCSFVFPVPNRKPNTGDPPTLCSCVPNADRRLLAKLQLRGCSGPALLSPMQAGKVGAAHFQRAALTSAGCSV